MTGNSKSPSMRQIFQTNSPGRWQRFKWGGRIVLLFLILGVVVFVIAVSREYTPSLPRIREQSQLYKKVLDTNRSFLFNNRLIRQYGGFRKYINQKVPHKPGTFPRLTKKKSSKKRVSPSPPPPDTHFRLLTKF